MHDPIPIAGGDTATPRNLKKRTDLIVGRYPDDGGAPKVLDCGCGAGDYVRSLTERGWDARGIEFLPDKIEKARAHGLGPEQVAQGDLENLPYEDGQFDAAVFNEVLEHVPDDQRALAEAFRVLRPGGHLFVFSPNRLYPFESHGVFLKGGNRRLPVWVPFIPWVPLAVGRKFFRYWARNYWPSELRKIVEAAGFAVEDTSFVWQTFEGISGSRTGWLRLARPALRPVSQVLEHTPGLRTLGVSQFIHAVKPA